jgi:hypothetical protein
MDYQQAKARKAELEAEQSRLGAILRAFPKCQMGLTPDHIRATPEWKTAKAESDAAFARLQKFNAYFVKRFATEYRDERRAKAAARAA